MNSASNGVKKSFYIFLTSLLGVMLFLIFHQVIFFFYLYLLAGGIITTGVNYYQLLALNYFTLTITLMLGAWYGIWLGLYWYKKVYEEGSHGGFVHHISAKLFWYPKPEKLQSQMSEVRHKLEQNMWELENLAHKSMAEEIAEPKPRVRRVVRKKAPKVRVAKSA